MTIALQKKAGRPALKFSTYATPEGKPRWSEVYLKEQWQRLIRSEKKPDFADDLEICRQPGCDRTLYAGNITGLCRDHIHGYLCQCDRCIKK